MPENPNYQNYQPVQPALEEDELDEATLDRVVGGLESPMKNQMQGENRSYVATTNIMRSKHDYVKNSISNIH